MPLSRRDVLRASGLSLLGVSGSGWFPVLAADIQDVTPRSKSVILLWMSGGPSQLDTVDLKPGHANGGEFQAIDTTVPGIQISEHLPQVARQMEHISLIRSMSTKEGDHGRATYLLRTGYLPQGPIKYPTLGSSLSKELGRGDSDLPRYISIGPQRFLSPAAFGPGFLGPQHAPLIVESNGAPRSSDMSGDNLTVRNLTRASSVTASQFTDRIGLLTDLDTEFQRQHPGDITQSHRSAYQQAVTMMNSPSVKAFDLAEEPAELRDAYGRNSFGQGCLLARRLIERGVSFVEVTLSSAPGDGQVGWDTHTNNFSAVRSLSGVLDAGWGTLLQDLKSRGLLDSTMIVWMGEFGRTPVINSNGGRDHFPVAWSAAACGGTIQGGQVIGATTPDGMAIKDRPVTAADLIATICEAVGVDHQTSNLSNVGRPIRLADTGAQPLEELFTRKST